MPTNRTKISRRRKPQITPEMVTLFKRARALHDKQDAWEEDGGRRREYLDTTRDLHSLMGRYPHQENVCTTIGADEPPTWMDASSHDDARWIADYKEAVELRREFERLADEKATS